MVHRPLLRLLLVVGLGKVHAAVVSEPAVLFPTAPSTATTTTTATTTARYSPIELASFYSTNASFSAVELDSTTSQDTAILTGSSSSSSLMDDDNDLDHQLHLHYQPQPPQHYQWNHVQNVFLHESTIVPTLLLTILVISAIVMTILLQPDDDDDDASQEEEQGYNLIMIPGSRTRTDLPVRIPVRPRCPLSPRMETIPELDQQQQPRCFMRRLSSSNGDDIESNSHSHRRDPYQAAFGRSLTN